MRAISNANFDAIAEDGIGCFERTGVAVASEGPGHAALIRPDRRAVTVYAAGDISGIDGSAAARQRVRPRRSAVVLQWAERQARDVVRSGQRTVAQVYVA